MTTVSTPGARTWASAGAHTRRPASSGVTAARTSRTCDAPRGCGEPGWSASAAAPALLTPVSAASGTSGSRKDRFRWTGPGSPDRTPVAAASARPSRFLASASSPALPCGAGTSTKKRTALPKIRTWSVVWLAPVPRISCGRSAVNTTSGTPEWEASSTAGCRFATAVPEVVTIATGPVAFAKPSAVNAATRSSMRT